MVKFFKTTSLQPPFSPLLMRPQHLKTQIFLDSGDPQETREALEMLGFLDGQTTNPSLIATSPTIKEAIRAGKTFSRESALALYHDIIVEISSLLPGKSVSVEVPADETATAEEMYTVGKEMFSWADHTHVKYPIIPAGLMAAEKLIHEGMRVNMTLCFSQEQAAAVAMATRGANLGAVFVSPFLGRIHDKGQNDMDLIQNILKMYHSQNSTVQVLAASIRDLEHFLQALSAEVDIITAPLGVLKQWKDVGMPIPESPIFHETEGFVPIAYQEIDLSGDFRSVNIQHPLTDSGLVRFTKDWNTLLGAV